MKDPQALNAQLSHALKRFRELKFPETGQQIFNRLPGEYSEALCSMNLGLYNDPLTDGNIRDAILLTVLEQDFQAYVDDQARWGLILKNEVPTLTINLLLSSTISYLRRNRGPLFTVANFGEGSKDKTKALEARVRDLERELAKRDDQQGIINRLQDEVDRLRLKLLEAEDSDEVDLIEEEAPVEEEEVKYDPLQLPDKGVIFVGGFDDFLGDLKVLKPGWTYVTSTQASPNFAGCEVVILSCHGTKHKLSRRVTKNIGTNVHVIVSTKQRAEAIIKEAEEKYGRIMKYVQKD